MTLEAIARFKLKYCEHEYSVGTLMYSYLHPPVPLSTHPVLHPPHPRTSLCMRGIRASNSTVVLLRQPSLA